jgi:hypothetical protein
MSVQLVNDARRIAFYMKTIFTALSSWPKRFS